MTTEHLSRLLLARLETGELSADEAARAHTHLGGCAQCAAARSELAQRSAAFLSNEDARLAALHARLAEPAPRASPAWLRPLLGLAGLAAAAVVAVVLVPSAPERDIEFKGAASLAVVVRHGDAQRPLEDGDEVAPGDALRLVVTTDDPVSFAAAWVDAAGVATLLYPATPEAPALRLETRGRIPLDGSLVLDDAPGEERLVWRLSPEPFLARDFLADVSRGGTTTGTLRVRKTR